MPELDSIQGVYYSSNDYAGFFRRTIIVICDMAILFLILLAAIFLFLLIDQENRNLLHVALITALISMYFYIVVLKRSLGTVGYMITGVRIVDYHGKQPSLVRMTKRMLWAIMVPYGVFLDLIWLTEEETRQTLRDKIVGTYVIKKNASPIGQGRQASRMMSLLGLCLRIQKVEKESEIKS